MSYLFKYLFKKKIELYFIVKKIDKNNRESTQYHSYLKYESGPLSSGGPFMK
jgi:hypothetical protein